MTSEDRDLAIRMIESVERNLTARINVHRTELDHLEDMVESNLQQVAKDVAEIKQQQAVQSALMAAGQKRINVMISVAVGVAIIVLAGAIAIIMFGPGAHP